MADTIRGDFPDTNCSDCGVKGCVISHSGPLVPPGQTGNFCAMCFTIRNWDSKKGRLPRSLGTLSMLAALDAVESVLPPSLHDEKVWKTLLVDYHPPIVKRVWGYYQGYRVSLHKIYPCQEWEALFHPHPWPSAMRILSGTYEMAVSCSEGKDVPPVAAKLILTAGASYEMTHPDSWHSVRPLEEPVFSLMVTGIPWKRSSPKGENLKPLTLLDKNEILGFFRKKYPTKL